MPYTFEEVRNVFEQVKDRPTFKGMSLAQFSDTMNQATGSEEYSQGKGVRWVKEASAGLDRVLQPVSEVAGGATRGLAEMLGASEDIQGMSQRFGEALPRGLVNFAPLAAGPWGYPLTAALSGSQTYEETGSPLAAGVSGGMAALLPASAKLGEKAVAPLMTKMFSQPVVSKFQPIIGQPTQKLMGQQANPALNTAARFLEPTGTAVGRQLGAAANMEATTQGVSLASQGQLAPWDTEHMFNLGASVLPFTALDIGMGVVRGGRFIGDEPGRRTQFRSELEEQHARELNKNLVDQQLQGQLHEKIFSEPQEHAYVIGDPQKYSRVFGAPEYTTLKEGLKKSFKASEQPKSDAAQPEFKHFNKVKDNVEANVKTPEEAERITKNVQNVSMQDWFAQRTHTEPVVDARVTQMKFNKPLTEINEYLGELEKRGVVGPEETDGTRRVLRRIGKSDEEVMVEAVAATGKKVETPGPAVEQLEIPAEKYMEVKYPQRIVVDDAFRVSPSGEMYLQASGETAPTTTPAPAEAAPQPAPKQPTAPAMPKKRLSSSSVDKLIMKHRNDPIGQDLSKLVKDMKDQGFDGKSIDKMVQDYLFEVDKSGGKYDKDLAFRIAEEAKRGSPETLNPRVEQMREPNWDRYSALSELLKFKAMLWEGRMSDPEVQASYDALANQLRGVFSPGEMKRILFSPEMTTQRLMVQQLRDKYSAKTVRQILEEVPATPQEKVAQLGRLSERLDALLQDAVTVAGEQHPGAKLLARGEELQAKIAELVDQGLDTGEALEVVYRQQMKLVGEKTIEASRLADESLMNFIDNLKDNKERTAFKEKMKRFEKLVNEPKQDVELQPGEVLGDRGELVVRAMNHPKTFHVPDPEALILPAFVDLWEGKPNMRAFKAAEKSAKESFTTEQWKELTPQQRQDAIEVEYAWKEAYNNRKGQERRQETIKSEVEKRQTSGGFKNQIPLENVKITELPKPRAKDELATKAEQFFGKIAEQDRSQESGFWDYVYKKDEKGGETLTHTPIKYKHIVPRLNQLLDWLIQGKLVKNPKTTKGSLMYEVRGMSLEEVLYKLGLDKEVSPQVMTPGKTDLSSAKIAYWKLVNNELVPRLMAAEKMAEGLKPTVKLMEEKPISAEEWNSMLAQDPTATTPERQQEILNSAAKAVKMSPELVQKVNSQFTLAAGLHGWFSDHFSNFYDPVTAKGFADIATKLGLYFTDVGKVRLANLAEGADKGQYGMAVWPQTLKQAFIAISKDSKWSKGEMGFFHALSIAGHEAGHLMMTKWLRDPNDSPQRRIVTNAISYAAGLQAAGRYSHMSEIVKLMLPEQLASRLDYAQFAGHVGMMKPTEFLAQLFGAHVASLASPNNMARYKTYLSDHGWEIAFEEPQIQQFLKGQFVGMKVLLDGMVTWADQMKQQPKGSWSKTAYVGRKDYGNIHEELVELRQVLGGIDSLLESQKKVDMANFTLSMMQSQDKDSWAALVADGFKNVGVTVRQADNYVLHAHDALGIKELSGVEEARNTMDVANSLFGFMHRKEIQAELGIQPYFWERWFMPMAQYSGLYPQLQNAADVARTYRPIAQTIVDHIAHPLLTKRNWFGKKVVDPDGSGIKAVVNNEKASEAFTRIALHKQEIEPTEVMGRKVHKVMEDSEMRELMPNLPKTMQDAVISFHRVVEEMMPRAVEMIKKWDQESFANQMGYIFQSRNPALTAKQGQALGKMGAEYYTQLYDAAKIQQGSLTADQLRMEIEQQFPGGSQVIESFSGFYAGLKSKWEKLENNPNFLPEIRLGNYRVVWKQKGEKGMEPGHAAFDSYQEAQAYKAKLKADRNIDAKLWDKYDRAQWQSGIHPDMLPRLIDMEKQAYAARVKALGPSANSKDLMDLFDQATGKVFTDIKAQGVARYWQPRKLAHGRETINSALGVLDYVQGLANGLAKRNAKEQIGAVLMEPELVKNPKLWQDAKAHFNNVVNPPGKEWRAFKDLNFANFMAYNLSSMMIEGTQTMLSFVPQITRDTGSVIGSYKALASGVSDILASVKNNGRFRDPELQKMVERAESEGRIGFGIMSEFNALEENAFPNLRNLTQGNALVEGSKMLTKPAYWYLNGAKWLYSNATQMNSMVAFVSAYKVGKGKLKLSPDKAYEYAAHTVDRTMFGGGTAGRPVGFFSAFGQGGNSPIYGAAGTLYSLSTYTAGMMGMMARFGREAISKQLGLTPAEKTAAKKAFGQMMLTQFAVGGALGLPLVPALATLVEDVFGIEVKKNTRKAVKEAFQAMFDSDEETGRMVSDVVMKGIPTATAGIDISSRVSLANVLGLNTYNGFSLPNMLGPTGSVFGNLAKSAKEAIQGEPGAGRNLLPVPWRNMIELYQTSGKIFDKSGNLIHEPNDYETAMYMLGFKPKAVMDAKDQAAMTKSSEMIRARQNEQFIGEATQSAMDGNWEVAKKSLLDRQKVDPMFDARAGARQVAEKMIDATTLRDFAREGIGTNARERQEIAQLYADRSIPEVQRLQMKKQLEGRLGVPGTGFPTQVELTTAQMVDRFMQMDPTLGRAEAVKMVQMMHRPNFEPRLW